MNARMARKVVGVLTSPRGMFWLLWLWALYYVTSAVWGEEAFASFVHAHSRNPLVLFMSLFSLVVFTGNLVQYARSGFDRRGWLIVPWLVLPVAVLVFLAGFVSLAGFGKSRFLMLQEGQEFTVPWNERTYMAERFEVDVVKSYFEASRGLGLLRSEPHMTLSSKGVSHRIGAFPPAGFDSLYFHILDFGIAPGLALYEQGRLVLSGNVNLRVLPPGREDLIDIEGLPYRIYMRLAPERIIERGGENIKQYDLDSPRYFIRVEKGDETVFDGISGQEQDIVFDEFAIRMLPHVHWVWLEVKKGIGVPLVWAGFVLLALGLPITLVLMAGRALKHVRLHAGG